MHRCWFKHIAKTLNQLVREVRSSSRSQLQPSKGMPLLLHRTRQELFLSCITGRVASYQHFHPQPWPWGAASCVPTLSYPMSWQERLPDQTHRAQLLRGFCKYNSSCCWSPCANTQHCWPSPLYKTSYFLTATPRFMLHSISAGERLPDSNLVLSLIIRVEDPFS